MADWLRAYKHRDGLTLTNCVYAHTRMATKNDARGFNGVVGSSGIILGEVETGSETLAALGILKDMHHAIMTAGQAIEIGRQLTELGERIKARSNA